MPERPELILPPGIARAGATASGLLVPVDSAAKEPAELSFVHTFVTWEELTGRKMSEAEVVEKLSRLSAYDCLQAVGRLSCMVDGGSLMSLEKQRMIMERLGWPQDARDLMDEKMGDSDGEMRCVFFPQQVVHLARLAVLHADPRPPDDFGGGAAVADFIDCLLGVSDLFEEGDLDENDPRSVMPWILRQLAINERQDSPLLWGRYYDILVRTWGEVATPEAFDAAEAFDRYTGISMADWLTTGLALYGRLLTYGAGTSEEYFIEPNTLFLNSPVSEEVWQPFLDRNSQSLEECRAALEKEEADYGPTQYRAQAFEARPLLRFPDGRLVPLACDSLQRRCTEGMFFELADGAQGEGLSREHFTSPFGAVFEEFVARAWERMMPIVGVSRVHRARTYMRGADEVDSTDVVLDGGTEGVIFCEVVSRRPRVATMTRGDWQSFTGDLATGPLKKARQLDLNIKDYRDGLLGFGDLRYEEGQRIWPMLVLTEGFPTMPPIPQYIAQEIGREGWLDGLPPLAILGSEDLAHLEALLEAGFGAVQLMATWKDDPTTANLPFSNFLTTLGDARVTGASQASFYRDSWDELTRLIRLRLFPGSI
jgi:hypothetical protein